MGRPAKTELKNQILADKRAGMSVDELCEKYNLTRNTIFYHCKQADKDLRARYTSEQKKLLATMTTEQLKEVAARTGRSFLALQRVAFRERDRKKKDLLARVVLQGYFDFHEPRELRLYRFLTADVIKASQALSKYGLVLDSPNLLVHPASGKWQPLDLESQVMLLKGVEGFLKEAAARLKEGWRER